MGPTRTSQAPQLTGIRRVVANLPPGYFALVMGTGIISVGLNDTGFTLASNVLLVIAVMSYIALWGLLLWRAISFPQRIIADLRNPNIAFAFFTIAAGTDVLAVRLFQTPLAAVAIGLVTSLRQPGLYSATCCPGRCS